MVSTASSTQKKPAPRLSTKDYMIRSKALDLLQRSAEVDHQIVYENDDDEDSDFSWITPISYQHSPSVPALERQCAPESARIAAQDQWIDIFLPAVSCISKACKEGVLCMVQQTSDGFQEIKNDIKGRQEHRGIAKEAVPSHRPPRSNTKQDLSQVQTGYHNGIRKRHTAGQHTAERYGAAATDPYYVEDDVRCYNPGEWRASGVLFIPTEELRQYQYDDVSAMTGDGSGGTNTTNKKCLGLFCPVSL